MALFNNMFGGKTAEIQARLSNAEAVIRALNKVQAIIEFKLDGTIIEANDNFLTLMGYTQAEIQGKHHGIFVDANYRNSNEYRQFWDRLRQGEFTATQFKRITKTGKEVWIQASYNPVFDEQGKPVKVIKFATDITAAKMTEVDNAGQLEAIRKSEAVISFNLDGTIIEANDNFLNALGYESHEVKGRHHSMFVEESMKNSAEYRQFWEKLGRGEYQAARYKRIGKHGKEVWIQASYNPIMDLNGRPFKVVKYATDVTEQVLAAQVLENAVEKSLRVVSAAKNNDLSLRVDMQGISGPVATLCTGINDLLDSMSQVILEVQEAAVSVDSAASEISIGNQNLSQRTEEQAASLEETASSMEELTGTVKQNAENARQANTLAKGASDIAVRGGVVVSQVVHTRMTLPRPPRRWWTLSA
ncbi:methyl-accepting chemotaxis protein [Leeia oryzae]|uniref:methyl-accepting chemotaxis protein n=1 Tax=Leeia oryzae TaxID=356662 RepID=UPI0003A93A93|nr:methyl-accepting chemotaxis protein [Leeia oryzae]